MLEGRDILCFGPTDWWHMNPSCTTHIMRRLSTWNRILYVNPFSSDLPARPTRGLGRRVLRKALSCLGGLRRVNVALHTFSPVFLPRHGHPTIDRLNNLGVRTQLRAVLRVLGMRPDLLWLENPRAADALDWFPMTPSLYHVSDAFAECPYTRYPHSLRAREGRLTRRCDLLVCASLPLFETKRALRNGAVHYIPHGVDYARFAAAAAARAPSPWLRDVPRPIAGYFGTLTAQNDIELLEYCVRKAPDVSFVFAGTTTAGDYSDLRAHTNVHFTGQVPYDDIPALAAGCDVCLLPWRITPWIQHCNPLKLMEYFAAGCPVVSVPIPQVQAVAGALVSIAATPADFLAAIRRELADSDPQRRAGRIALAARHDWSHQLALLSAAVERALLPRART